MSNPDHPVVERTDVNPFAVVTGASRGIGAAYARLLASRGYDLLLVSRDEARLTHLSHELETNHRIQAHVFVADLAQPDAAHQLFVESRQYRQTPEMLINNAGFGLYGEFVSHPLPRIQEMLHVHVRTVVESIRLFLPGMIERGSGTIINVASIAGLLPIPHFAEYAATKAFLVSFSEALAEEVRPTGVVVQACCPGQTETDFHITSGFRPSWPPPHANGRPGSAHVTGRVTEQAPRGHHRLARQAGGLDDEMVATDVPHQNRRATLPAGNPVGNHRVNAVSFVQGFQGFEAPRVIHSRIIDPPADCNRNHGVPGVRCQERNKTRRILQPGIQPRFIHRGL